MQNATDVSVTTFVTVTMTETVMTLSGKFHLFDQSSGLEVPTTINNTGFTQSATLDPDDQLLPFHNYFAQVDQDTMDVDGNPTGFVMGWSFTTGADTDSPEIRETTPKANSVAPITTSITILFDENVTSIVSFSVTSSATTFPGSLSASTDGHTWTFTPAAVFPPSTVISVAITNATDSSGNVQNFTYNFTTAP